MNELLLKKVGNATGVSGHEDEVQTVVMDELRGCLRLLRLGGHHHCQLPLVLLWGSRCSCR